MPLLVCLVVPIASGLVVYFGFFVLDGTRFAVKGVVAPYFTVLALLFSLFASHTTVEVWEKIRRVNFLLFMEANSARSMLRISEPFDSGPTVVRGAVDKLLREVLGEEASARPVLGAQIPDAFRDLYRIAADPKNFGGNSAANMEFYRAIEIFRASWFERTELRKRRVSLEVYSILFLFGFLTQVSIALSQAGNLRALGVTVMLFSIAYMAAVTIVFMLDNADNFTNMIAKTAVEDVARNPLGFGGLAIEGAD